MSYQPVAGPPPYVPAPTTPPVVAPAAGVAPVPGAPDSVYVPRQNQLAIVALVLSFVFSIGGIICGHIALSQIKRTGQDGHGIALTGLIVGYVFTAFWVLYIVVYITFIAVLLPQILHSIPNMNV